MALHADSLNLISLCTGGGGLDLGFELAFPDARSVVLVEGEAFGVATLVQAMEARLMAPAPVWSDVRTFDGRPWRGLVDGLIGGIPCQPHSLAGRRKGAEDERDLWSPTRRIIVQARPWFVGIENVRGFVSSGGLERVWRDLRRLGYAVEAGLFTAAEVGASHERERCFVLAVANSDGRQQPWRAAERRETASGRSCDEPSRSGSHVGHPDSAGPMADSYGCGRRSQGNASKPSKFSNQDGCELVNTEGDGRRERRTEPELHRGRDATAGASRTMADTDIIELRREPSARQQQELQRDNAAGRTAFPALYPPRPSDLDNWRRVLAHSPHLEPAVRRMADGVAAKLDLSGPHAARIERLRQLGNGVVPLEAAYAFRTLSSRLAARGIAGAAKLVRIMGEIER